MIVKLELELAPDETFPPWQLRLRATDIAPDLLITPEVYAVLRKPVTERTSEEKKQLDDFRLAHDPAHFALSEKVADLKKQIDETDLSIPITLVMEEMAEPRPTFVLKRGQTKLPARRGRRHPAGVAPVPARDHHARSGSPRRYRCLRRLAVVSASSRHM